MVKSLKADAVSIGPVIGRADSVAGVHQGAPPLQYTVAPVTVTGFPQGLRLIAWSRVIDEPTAAHQLDTSRIALMKGPFQVEYYADVEWTNNAPPGTAVADPIVPEHRAPAGMASTHQTLSTDFLLLSNLRKFQVERDARMCSKRQSCSSRHCYACRAASPSRPRVSRRRRQLRPTRFMRCSRL